MAQQESYPIEIREKFENKFWRLNNLYWIIDKRGKRVKFHPNEVQEQLFDDLWYLNVVLKARQFGITTFVDLYFLDECIFNNDVEAGIIAHNITDAQKIFRRKVKYPYDNLPEQIRDQCVLTTDSKTELVFNNNSAIYVGTSMRSGTVQYLHVCLAGDSEILMKDGFVKEIKDIKTGELVLTDRGSYQKVEKNICNKLVDLDELLYGVHTFGYYKPLKLTGTPEWKRTKDLIVGDYIAYPIREPSLKTRDGLIPFGPQQQNGGGLGRLKNSGNRVSPDFNLGWLSGFYLAEGTIRRINNNPPTCVTFSIHEKEVDILMAYIETLNLKNRSKGRLTHVRRTKDSKTVMVDVNSKDFAWFLEERFGDSNHKYIPDSVWGLGSRYIKGLIKGYLDGDGGVRGRFCAWIYVV